MPLSIEYVARHLEVGWGTARAMLLELALEGKIACQKTTKSWIFWVKAPTNERTTQGE